MQTQEDTTSLKDPLVFTESAAKKVKTLIDRDDLLKCIHDGYKKLCCYHTRTFSRSKNKFKIGDRLESKKKHKFYSNLHFHPDVELKIHNKYLILEGIKIKMVGYINPKLVEYNYPLGFNKYIKAIKLISLVKKNSSLEFFNYES